MRKWLLSSVLGLGLGLATSAHAVTVNLAATIGEVGQNHSSGPGVVGLFAIGDGVQFSFDYLADDSVPAGDNNGMKYVVTRFTLTTPVYTATVLGRGALKFAHQPNYDTFSMYSGIADLTETYGVPIPGVPLLNGFYLSSFGFNLEATGGGAFKSNSLRQPLIAGDFDAFNLHFSFREPGSTRAVYGALIHANPAWGAPPEARRELARAAAARVFSSQPTRPAPASVQ